MASWQWQAWDLLSGQAEPELGGAPGWLDAVGVNHYHLSQWELDTGALLDWAARDPRRQPLAALLQSAWARYGRPLVLAETSHVGVGRADWLHDVLGQVRQARSDGVPVDAVCVYPLVDRTDGNDTLRWHRSGVWHVDPATLSRSADAPTLHALRQWRALLPAPAPAAARTGAGCALAFSHLRWDFARHRARQLLERACGGAAGPRLVFVEEPLGGGHTERIEVVAQGPGIEVWVPHLPGAAGGFDADSDARLLPLLRRQLGPQHATAACDTQPLVAWLSTRWRGRWRGRCARHACCTTSATSCRRSAMPHPSCPCTKPPCWRLRLLPNGVDARHFGRRTHGLAWEVEEARQTLAQACPGHIDGNPGFNGTGGHPVFGYAGVIDERLDKALLAALADSRPQWQFWLIGPVLKIDPASLPQRPNLHWFGPLPYGVLPWLMQHWQAAVLPLVVDALTRPACPLKVLEALAAGLPVVAVPLSMLEPWRAAGVRLAAGPLAFAEALEGVLAEPPDSRRRRRRQAFRAARNADWAARAAELRGWLLARPVRAQTAAEVSGHPCAIPAGA